MFEQTFLERDGSARRPWPVAFSFAAQAACTGAILLIPLLNTAQLALKPAAIILYAPPPSVPPQVVQQTHSLTRQVAATMLRPVFKPAFTAPTRVPQTIVTTPGPMPPSDLPMASAGGVATSSMFGLDNLSAQIARAEQPKPPQPAPPKNQSPVRVSNGVQAAKLISQPRPVYPALARSARISGTVHLQAIIARDGTIRNLQVTGGPPLLIKAALDAVSRWVYQPTLLSGEPVEVFTEIDVNFTLNQ